MSEQFEEQMCDYEYIIDGEMYKSEYIEDDDYGYIYSGNIMYLKKNIETNEYQEPYYYFTGDLVVKYYKTENIFVETKNDKIVKVILTGRGSWSDDVIIFNINDNIVTSKIITEHGYRRCIITYENNVATDIKYTGASFGCYKLGEKVYDILQQIPTH